MSYWMLNMIATYHTKKVKCNSLGLALAIDPLPPEGGAYYDFPILNYIRHKMKHVSSLRVAALA